ncbi:MAG: flagellin [Parvibaculum sp.]|nr:flagellin [Parvibaculum sp.]
MTSVTLSAAVRNNLLSLQGTAKMMADTQNRLATGNKVNTAVDDANSFFTAAGLNNRASDLATLQDSMSLAVKTVNAASSGIDSIQKLVTQAKSVATQALQTTITAATASETVVATDFTTAANSGLSLTFTIGDNAATSVVLTTNIASAGDLKAALSGKVSGLTVSVSGGDITFSVAGGQNFSVSGTAATLAVGGDIATTSNGKNRDAFVEQYNDLRDQIDQLAADSSFNGINLMNGAGTDKNLTVNFNADQTSTLTLKAVDMSSTGLGLSAVTDWSTKTAVDATNASLDSAKNTLRTQASTFGSNLAVINNRQSYTQSTIDNLQAGAGDLTLADINQEGANLLALQTRQSLAQTALSLSNQAQSSILSILR